MFGRNFQLRKLFIILICSSLHVEVSSAQLFGGKTPTTFVGKFSENIRYKAYDVAIFSNSVAQICVVDGVGSQAKFIPFVEQKVERYAVVSYPHLTIDMLNAGVQSEYIVNESDILITNGVLYLYSKSDNEVVLSDFVIQYKPSTER